MLGRASCSIPMKLRSDERFTKMASYFQGKLNNIVPFPSSQKVHLPQSLISSSTFDLRASTRSKKMYTPRIQILLVTLPMKSGVLGRAETSKCTGASQAGYCCNGSIFQKNHNDDFSASNFICCEGDPHLQVNAVNGSPTSCTESNAASSSGSSESSSANGAVRAMITSSPYVFAAAVAGGALIGM